MAFNVTINRKQLNSVVKRLERTGKAVTSKRIMNTILLKVKNNILLRTNAGKDVNMNSFQAYSSRYAAKEGKTIVNLTRIGTMLNAMTQKVLSNTKGVIFFINSGYNDSTVRVRDLVGYHNTGDGVPKREFFGANKLDDKIVLKEYQKAINKARKKAGI